MDRADASAIAAAAASPRVKKPLLPNPRKMALPDTEPNTQYDEEEDEQDEGLSRALSKVRRNPKKEPMEPPRGGGKAHGAKVAVEENRSTRRKEKTVTVVQSASAQGINIRIETPRKKRTRNADTSQSPQEITIQLTLNANVSVNARGKKNGTVVVSATQQNMSLESSRNDESLEASQDVIDISSATEDNNVSRSLFDDY